MTNAASQLKPDEFFLQIHITSKCNLACKHCYMDAPAVDTPVELFSEIIDQLVHLRDTLNVQRVWVQLTGGEPLLHPSLPDILDYSAANLPTKVLTNGTLIDSRMAQLLARHCKSVQMSFDGTKDLHDSWRGGGSFEAALEGLAQLKQAGVRTSARMTLARKNQHCVEDLLAQLGPLIDGFNVSRVVPIGPCAEELPDTDVYRRVVYRLYGAHFRDARIRLKDPFFGPLMKVDYGDDCFLGCSAGVSGLCITEVGDVYPCRRLPIKLGSVQNESLSDIYHNHPLLHSLKARSLSGRCGKCEDRLRCGGSRCIAYALTGDPLAEDPGCIFA